MAHSFLKKHLARAGKKTFPLLLFLIFVGVGLLFQGVQNIREFQEPLKLCPFSDLPQKDLFIHGKILHSEVAEASFERRCGLSLRDTLPEDQGMLFVFKDKGFYGIWMKDMRFPIDIIWIDEALRIVDIKRNVLPESYPAVFKPKTEALYVIETLAGVAQKYGIVVGDTVTF